MNAKTDLISRRRVLRSSLMAAVGGICLRHGRALADVREKPTLADAEKILLASDRYRGGLAQGGRWTVSLHASDGEQSQDSGYRVKAKGTNALAECLAPARSRGEQILFQRNALWFYKPGLRRPIALSPRQRLVGEAANGDIAATNYAGDYQVESVVEAETESAWVLMLRAKSKSTTYDRIRYWISQRDQLGIKAEFLTLQGTPFKRAMFEYKNQIAIGSQTYPFVSKMTIVNATFANQVTTLVYNDPSVSQVADADFNVNGLVR